MTHCVMLVFGPLRVSVITRHADNAVCHYTYQAQSRERTTSASGGVRTMQLHMP